MTGLLAELLARQLVFRRTLAFSVTEGNGGNPLNRIGKAGAALLRELPTLLGLLLFFGTAYFSFFAFFPPGNPVVQLVFLALLLGISTIRVVVVLSRILFSPRMERFRALPLSNPAAYAAHALVSWSGVYIISALIFSLVVHRLGAQLATVQLLQLGFATLLLVATGLGLLFNRNRIAAAILTMDTEEDGQPPGWGHRQIGAIWHLLALAYLLVLWLLLVNDLVEVRQNRGAFLLSFFIVPIWMAADRIIQGLALYAMTTLKIHQESHDDGAAIGEEEAVHRRKGRLVYLRVKTLARLALAGALLLWIASLWRIEVPFLSKLNSVLFDSLIISLLALMSWRFISGWIERKIAESMPEGVPERDVNDDEWGGAAARGRSYTLLPMIRKGIATILVVMVTMTILSSMGVDIGPLLAGAGVVGLAVGFGAQKLVADMFSGFFYLLDDAFRVGEYLTAGSVSGTVENITLRNIMLRHHRGMLQIIPHSELGAITNYMRGGIIVKFNLDFPYDADIDKIRKVVKKVGQAMLADEELGKDILRPVKSQGVREIANSVMTIRVKFTARPGAHFIIRREAFKRITEALHAQGIHYAHRRVIVDIGQQADAVAPLMAEQARSAAGAAARALIDSEKPVLPDKVSDPASVA